MHRTQFLAAYTVIACAFFASGAVRAQATCSDKLKDQKNPSKQCIEADSSPTLGDLFPNSIELNRSATPAAILSDPALIFDGSSVDESFAAAVAGAGDVNGDGVDDFIVGSPNDNSLGLETGKFAVYSGRDSSLLFSALAGNPGTRANLGCAVDGIGDINGDGFGDVLVGERHNATFTTHPGYAYVYYGPDGATKTTLTGFTVGDRFGSAVAGLGDVDGDGRGDFVVGASGGDYARVFSGATVSELFPGAIVGVGGDHFGGSVAGPGDLNGDGTPDLLVGAPYDFSFRGKAYGYSGATGGLLVTYTGDATGDHFGESVSGVADVSGDGRADVVIGAPFAQSIAGKVYVRSGAADVNVIPPIVGPNPQDLYGFLVSGLPDISGDGFPDFMARTGLGPNKVLVFSGLDGSVLHEILGEAANDAIGSGLGNAGTRLLIGAAGHDAAASNAGRLYVFATQNVGIGSWATESRLTVAGTINTQSGGLKFPDGTVQVTADVPGPQGNAGPPGPAGPQGPPAVAGVLDLNNQSGSVSVAGGPQVSVTASGNFVTIGKTQGAVCSAGSGPVPGSSTQYSPGAQCFTDVTSVGCGFGFKYRTWTCQSSGTWQNTFFSSCVNPGPKPICF